MRPVEPDSLGTNSVCAIVARSSAVAPEFLLGENRGSALLAARWRRRQVRLVEPIRLTHHVLSYCVSGSGTCTIVAGGMRNDHLQQAGALTFLRADQPVQWALDSTSDIVHIHLYLTEAAVHRFARAHSPTDRAPQLSNFVAARDSWLEGYFRLLISEYELCGQGGRLGDSLFLDQTENLLIGRLLFDPPAGAVDAAASSPRRRVSPLRPTLLGRINEYVLQNLAAEIRLQHLARLAGVSVDHFVRAFRQATGMTPYRYVLELRLNRARDLLREGAAPITQVAHDCGFSSPARFSVAFHDHFGLPPSKYRRLH
jgi:AraC family transcriptional regulator